MVVLARLSLFGQGAARLHDEVIAVAATWRPGDDRTSALQPLDGAQREAVWVMLQQALGQADPALITDGVRQQLQARAAADVAALRPTLDQAAEAARELAAARLKERAGVEADALEQVLRNQRKRINATLRQRSRDLSKLESKVAAADPTALIPGLAEEVDVPALDLAKLSKQEEKQLRADRKHWQRRLEVIERELEREPARIKASYQVVTHRLEPTGLVHLWPVSG